MLTTENSTIITQPISHNCNLCDISGKIYCCEDCTNHYCSSCFETHECYTFDTEQPEQEIKEKPLKNPFQKKGASSYTEIELSKKLSNILRHNAVKWSLPIRSDGFVKLSDLTSHYKFSHTNEDEIRWIVFTSDKQRFQISTLEDGKEYIRATQGHTIQSVTNDGLLEEIHSPSEIPVCIHGTYKKNLPGIMRDGLKRCSRNHIHLATDKPNGKVISGARVNTEVFIHIDTEKAMANGLKFYRSVNGVILTEGPLLKS